MNDEPAHTSSYDVIIMGGGVAGLTTGIQLCRDGTRVALFEKNPGVGGCCVSFRRHGFVFDAGVHALGGVGNPGSFVGRFIHSIGFDLGRDFVRYEPAERFFVRGEKYEVAQDFSCFVEGLKQKFPKEERAVEEFFRLILKIFRRRADWTRPVFEEYLPFTYQDMLERSFTDRTLKDVLAGFTGYLGYRASEVSFIAVCLMLGSNFYESSYYPKNGMGAFAVTLAERFRAYGGSLFTGEEVCEVCYDSPYYQVTTSKKKAYRSKQLVAAISLDRFCSIFPPAAQCFQNARESLSMFVLYLGVEADKGMLAEKSGWYFGESDSYYRIHIPTLIAPALAPSGKHVVEILAPIPAGQNEFASWVGNNDKKRQYRDYLLNKVSKIIPELPNSIIVEESASPATFHRYTGNKNGAVYGLAMCPEQMVKGRPKIMTEFPHLFYVGHWSTPGTGIASVIYSGLIASEAIKMSG
jgi:prolycopene isomerase